MKNELAVFLQSVEATSNYYAFLREIGEWNGKHDCRIFELRGEGLSEKLPHAGYILDILKRRNFDNSFTLFMGRMSKEVYHHLEGKVCELCAKKDRRIVAYSEGHATVLPFLLKLEKEYDAVLCFDRHPDAYARQGGQHYDDATFMADERLRHEKFHLYGPKDVQALRRLWEFVPFLKRPARRLKKAGMSIYQPKADMAEVIGRIVGKDRLVLDIDSDVFDFVGWRDERDPRPPKLGNISLGQYKKCVDVLEEKVKCGASLRLLSFSGAIYSSLERLDYSKVYYENVVKPTMDRLLP